MKTALIAGLGGFAGTMPRYWINAIIKQAIFPATLFINLIGCCLIGMVMSYSWKNEEWKILFGIGFCGGFTTFSAFARENVQLMQKGKFLLALVYVLLSVSGGLAAAFAGFKLIQK